MAVIPSVPFASDRLAVSSARGASPSQAAAPYEALTNTGLQIGRIAEQSMQRDGEAQAMEDFSNYQVEMANKQAELQKEYADNPEGYVTAYTDAANKSFQEIKGNSDNKYYSEVMEARFQSMRPTMAKSAIQFEAQQKTIVQKQRLSDSIDNLSLLVRQDPSQLGLAQAQIQGNIASASENALITDAAGLQDAAISQIHAAAVDSYLNAGDTENAKAMLAQEGFKERLGYEATVRAENSILNIEAKQAKEFEKAQEERGLIDTASIILEAGLPVDPKNKNVTKSLNAYYNNSDINQRLAAGDTQAAQQLEEIASKTSFLPELATSTLRGLLTNGNIEQRTFAADTLSRIEEVNTIAMDDIPQRDRARAMLATEYLRSGMPPKKVFEAVDFQTDGMNKDLISARKLQLNELVRSDDVNYASMAEEASELPLGQWLFELGDPDVPADPTASAKMQLDYKRLFDSAFMQVGDEGVAEKIASKNFKRHYGNYDGEIMKYAPSNYYMPQSSSGWIKEQAESDAKSLVPDAKGVRIIADSQTAREASTIKKPTYALMYEDEMGRLVEIRDADGNIKRFQPDATEVEKKAEQERLSRLGISSKMVEGRSVKTEDENVLNRMGMRGYF